MKFSMKLGQAVVRRGAVIVCALLLLLVPFGAPVLAQEQGPYPPAAQLLSPQQLDAMVAPIALYPDALLSQVLVAATYPDQGVQAAQWLQQNRGLQGQELMEAAQQQNWDPSIQALVAFPDVIARLASNPNWTSDLGNAFLNQQTDVMNAVQQLRAQAQAAGRLSSNGQQQVITDTQNGQTAIEIVPTDPQVMYVPAYDPAYIWGPPVWGYYPALYYPAFGFGFGRGIFVGTFFGGWGGWGAWGWHPNWFHRTIVPNPVFFSRYGFHNFAGRGLERGGVWNGRVAAAPQFRGNAGGWRHFGEPIGNNGRMPVQQPQGNVRSFVPERPSPAPAAGGGARFAPAPGAAEGRGFGGARPSAAPMPAPQPRSFAPQRSFQPPAGGGFRSAPAPQPRGGFGGGGGFHGGGGGPHGGGHGR
jgi:hypothetical protein